MDYLACSLTEVKFTNGSTTDAMTFSGYGAVFGNVDAYGDVIAPGAFAKTLAEAKQSGRWPAMLLQHGGWGMGSQDMTPIGVYTELAEDGHGLKVEGTLAPTPRGHEAYALLKMQPRPAIDGLSIGYVAKKWTARSKPDEPRRVLEELALMEISLVTFPANPQARVSSVKSLLELASLAECERVLRDAGFTRAQALEFVTRIKSLVQSDSAPSESQSDSAFAEIAASLRARTIHIPKRNAL